MRLRSHFKIFVPVTVIWALFWLGGLPDYYQQYSTTAMAYFDAALVLPLWLVVLFFLKRARTASRLKLSLWFCFYITVPLFIYDYIYCGLYLKHGMSFLGKYWYLTVYYVIPWLVLPPTGRLLEKRLKG